MPSFSKTRARAGTARTSSPTVVSIVIVFIIKIQGSERAAQADGIQPGVEARLGELDAARLDVGAQHDAFHVGVERPAVAERPVKARLRGRTDAEGVQLEPRRAGPQVVVEDQRDVDARADVGTEAAERRKMVFAQQ